jgi:hypothetical protein
VKGSPPFVPSEASECFVSKRMHQMPGSTAQEVDAKLDGRRKVLE